MVRSMCALASGGAGFEMELHEEEADARKRNASPCSFNLFSKESGEMLSISSISSDKAAIF